VARKPATPASADREDSTAPSYKLPAYGTPQREPSSPVREPPTRARRKLRLPAVDDRLARPEEGEEYVDDERFGWETMAGEADHADPQCQLAYVVRACVAAAYVASTELLTRTDKKSDFATDVCVRRKGTDPETGGRFLEEISFEVANSQTLSKLEKRAKKLVARGVRRVFGILVKAEKVQEWTRDGWKERPLSGEVRDQAFKKPLRIRAILDAADADRLVAEALWEKREPYLVKLVADGRAEGVAEGEAKGLAEGEAKGLAEGEAMGLAEAILRTFDHHGITLDADNRQEILSCRDTALLRRWLDQALLAEDASDVLAELEKDDLV
jgi:hypothetical protein